VGLLFSFEELTFSSVLLLTAEVNLALLFGIRVVDNLRLDFKEFGFESFSPATFEGLSCPIG